MNRNNKNILILVVLVIISFLIKNILNGDNILITDLLLIFIVDSLPYFFISIIIGLLLLKKIKNENIKKTDGLSSFFLLLLFFFSFLPIIVIGFISSISGEKIDLITYSNKDDSQDKLIIQILIPEYGDFQLSNLTIYKTKNSNNLIRKIQVIDKNKFPIQFDYIKLQDKSEIKSEFEYNGIIYKIEKYRIWNPVDGKEIKTTANTV